MEGAAMESSSFTGLDVRVDRRGVFPKISVEAGECNAVRLKTRLPEMQRGKDVRLAVMKERDGRRCNAQIFERGRSCMRQIEQSMSEHWAIGEVAIETAEGVEGSGKMVAAAP